MAKKNTVMTPLMRKLSGDIASVNHGGRCLFGQPRQRSAAADMPPAEPVVI